MKSVTSKLKLALTVCLVTAGTAVWACGTYAHAMSNPVPSEVVETLEATTDLSVKDAKKVDFTGKWEGNRYQYNYTKTGVMRVYHYEFELVQSGDFVTGISTITAENGDYAIVKIRGMVVGDKLHFEEYEIDDQIKDEHMVWCYKTGELRLGQNGETTVIYGPTQSFTSTYNLPCTGGFTMMQQETEDSDLITIDPVDEPNQTITDLGDPGFITVNAYPNPFTERSTVSYVIEEDAKVKVEVFEISGKKVTTLINEKHDAGTYTTDFVASDHGYTSGAFIVKFTIGGEVFSKQIMQSTI